MRWIVLATLLLTVGCVNWPERRAAYYATHGTTPEVQALIEAGKIWIGMHLDEVLIVFDSGVGGPNPWVEQSRMVIGGVYRRVIKVPNRQVRLYFDRDDRLVSWYQS